MNTNTSAVIEGQSIGLITAIFDSESQSSKEVNAYAHLQIVQKDFSSISSLRWFKG